MIEFLVGMLVVVTFLVACYVVGSVMTLKDKRIDTFDKMVYGMTAILMTSLTCYIAYEIGKFILWS